MGGGCATHSLLDCSADPGRVRGGQGPHSGFIREDAGSPLVFVSMGMGGLCFFWWHLTGGKLLLPEMC